MNIIYIDKQNSLEYISYSLMLILYPQLVYSMEEFQAVQPIVFAVFGTCPT